jgi:ABC-2 type transport system ATP-binding protein
MIEVINVRKVYGNTVAVSEASFTIQCGEAVGLLGLNGAGKTTILSMLASILTPSSGTISLCGHSLPTERKAAQRLIGFMPDAPPLYPDMRVEEYLMHIGRLRGLKKKELPFALDSVLERCNLTQARRALCSTLSRGYAQRVSLAQALIHDPPILLLDEPTSGLDPEQTRELRSLLAGIAGQKALLFSSHILSEVEAVCSRVLIMHGGFVQQSLAVNELAVNESLEDRFLQIIGGSDNPCSREEAA